MKHSLKSKEIILINHAINREQIKKSAKQDIGNLSKHKS